MDARTVERLELAADLTGAASLAAAVGLAVSALFPIGMAYAAGAITFLVTRQVLGSIPPAVAYFHMPPFIVTSIECECLPELLLSEADRVTGADPEEPLILDDVLSKIGPDSRVVRLFDRAAMPIPGQLKDRIDHHLGAAAPHPALADASEALYTALNELRRSLR